MKEMWKPISGYESLYEVSNYGRVRSLDHVTHQRNFKGNMKEMHYKGNLLKFDHGKVGHCRVTLCRQNKTKRYLVHRLVLAAFGDIRSEERCYGCHNDGNPLNNYIDNLRWDTQAGNMADKKKHSTWQGGENNSSNILTDANVRAIKNMLMLRYISRCAIARAFSVSSTTIYYIACGKTWSHVTIPDEKEFYNSQRKDQRNDSTTRTIN